MEIVRFTDANDTIVLGSDATFLGRGGDDVYVFEPSFIPANASIRIGDSEGDNTLRFPDGLSIVQSDISTLGNGGVTIVLTLSNNTTVVIDNAEGFSFQTGGDVAGNGSVDQNLTEFVEDTLDTTVPAPNETSQGGAVTIGELPVVSISGADQVEGNPGDAPREVVFTLELDEPNLQRDVTVTLQLDQGLVPAGSDAATAGDDFAAFPSTTVTIPRGATSTEVPVDIIPDLIPENAEGIGLKIVAADGATIADEDDLPQPGEGTDDGDPSAVASIIDDDVAAPVPLVQISGGTLLEGDDGDAPVLSFNLNLVDPAAPGTALATTVPVDVTVQTGAAGDTATAGSDYTPVTTTVTIPAGATVGQVDVTLSGDEDIEADETFTAEITNVVNADGASVGATATGTIENDDGPTLTIRDASVQEGDAGTTATMTFTIESSAKIGEDVTVDVTTFDQASAAAGVDFTKTTETVTIDAGTTEATFEVEVTGDDLEEGDETFGARISNPVVVGKPNVTARLDGTEATGTIVDDDGSFVLTEQTDVFTTTQNSSGGVFADDGQNIFIANEATLNPSDELEGGGQPAAPAGTGPYPPLEGDFFDQLFYSTDVTVAAGATVNEAGFSVTDVEQMIVQSNAVDTNGDGAAAVFDMSNADVGTVGSRNSASGVRFTELAAPVDVVLDNLTNADRDNDVTVLSDADEAAGGFKGDTESFVSFDDSDVETLTIGLDGPPATGDGLETVSMRVSGATPTLKSLVNPENFLQTLNVVIANGDDDDFIFGDAKDKADVIGSDAFSTLNIGSEEGKDGDFRLLEDVNPGEDLTIDARGAKGEGPLEGNMVLSEISVNDREVTVFGGVNNDVVSITGDPTAGTPNDSFSLGGGDSDTVLIGELDSDAGGINAPTNGGTEILGIVEEGKDDGIGGTLDASGLDGLREIRLLNKDYGTDDAEDDFGAMEPDAADLSGDLTGYENGFTVNNAPADTKLVTRLDANNGPLTIDGSSPFTLNTLINNSSTIAALNLTDVSTFTLDIDDLNSGTQTLTIESLNADPDLEKIVVTSDDNDDVGVTIGNANEVLEEERSANLIEYDGSAIDGPQDVTDLQSSDDPGYKVTTGDSDDKLAVGDDNIDDNVSPDPLIGNDPNSGDFNDDTFPIFDDPDFDDGFDQADTLNAGGGDDTILAKDVEDLEGSDEINGGAGSDTLRFIEDDDLDGDLIPDDDGIPAFDEDGVPFLAEDGDFAGVDGVEVVEGSDDANGRGDDFDVADIFAGAFEQANLRGGDDTLDGSDATLALSVDAGLGNDSVTGGSGNDFIEGQAGDDDLLGNDGDDTLVAGAGMDVLRGGNGDDRFRFGTDELMADDIVDGADIPIADTSNDDRIELDNDLDNNGLTSDIDAVLGANVSNVEGIDILDTDPNSDGDGDTGVNPGDVFIEFTDAYTNGPIDIDGSALDGVSGANPFDGETLFVHATEADASVTVTGGGGDDTFLGSDFVDPITGNGDVFTGNGGNDQAAGRDGDDTLNGNDGNDVIRGGEGNDEIDGGGDDDILLGEEGVDLISGGSGNDLILGGEGADELNGGTGSDTFAFLDGDDSRASDSTSTVFGGDTITDFDFGDAPDGNPATVDGEDDKIAVVDNSKLEIGTVITIPAADLATLGNTLDTNNNLQNQFAIDAPGREFDVTFVEIGTGTAAGLHLAIEDGTDTKTFKSDEDIFIRLENAQNTDDFDQNDFVTFGGLGGDVSINNSDDGVTGLADGTSILDQVFTFQDGLPGGATITLNEPLDGGFGEDTLKLGNQNVDFSNGTVENFEELDLNGNTATLTLEQYNQFNDIVDSKGGGEIVITDPENNDGTAEAVDADGDVSAYTIDDTYGEPVVVNLAADTKGDLSQDLTIETTGGQDDVVNGPAAPMNESVILTGDGDDTVNLGDVTKMTDSTINGEEGSDTININDVVTINPTDILGGTGADVINANSLETVAAGSLISLGDNPVQDPDPEDERDILNAGALQTLAGKIDGNSGDDVLNVGNVAGTTLTVSGDLLGGSGADKVNTLDLTVTEDGTVDTGTQDDTLTAEDVVLEADGADADSQAGELLLGEGGDSYTATSTTIGDEAKLDAGQGNDSLDAGTTTIDVDGTLDLGSGDDTLNTNLKVDGELLGDDGVDKINVNGPLTVGKSGLIDLGSDASDDNLIVTGDTTVADGGQILGQGGGDTISLNGTNSIGGTVDAGTNDDVVNVGVTTLTSKGTLDGGGSTDTLNVNGDSDFSAGTLKNFETVDIADGVTVKVTETQLENNGTYEGAGVETIEIIGNSTDVTGAFTIDNYLYEEDDGDGFAFTVGAQGQNFKSTGASTEDTVDLSGGQPYSGTLDLGGADDKVNNTGPLDGATIDTGDGADTVNAVSGMVNGATIDTGPGGDTVFLTGNLKDGTVSTGKGDDTVRIEDTAAGDQSIGSVTLNGGSGTNTLIIDTNGETVDISGADIIGFTKVEFEGDGTVRMTTTQHQALSPFFDAPNDETIEFADAPGVPATGNPQIETYQLNTKAGATDDGNTFTVDGFKTDNTGQTVIGGTGKDTVIFRAEEEDGTDIDPGDLDLSGGGSKGDVLNIETNGTTTDLAYNIGAGDVSTFEQINVELDGNASNDDNFKIAFGNADIDNDLTFTVKGDTQQVGDSFQFKTSTAEESSITVQGLQLNETAGGADSVNIVTGNGKDSVSLTAATTLTAATEVDIDLNGGTEDSFTFDLNGFDATFDATADDSFFDTEAFVFEDTNGAATAFSLTLAGSETVQTIDASGLDASFTLDASTISNLLPTASGIAIQDSISGSSVLDVGSAEGGSGGADFTVNLSFGIDDILIDNAGNQENVVTVLNFTPGTDDVGLNQTGGGITTETEITTVVGSNDALDTADTDSGPDIDTFVDLTGFAPAIATDLDDLSDGGAVELAIIEAQMDSAAGGTNPAGEVDGQIYVALTDGTDATANTAIYRATISTGADFNVDSTSDITDLKKVAELDGVFDIELNDIF